MTMTEQVGDYIIFDKVNGRIALNKNEIVAVLTSTVGTESDQWAVVVLTTGSHSLQVSDISSKRVAETFADVLMNKIAGHESA